MYKCKQTLYTQCVFTQIPHPYRLSFNIDNRPNWQRVSIFSDGTMSSEKLKIEQDICMHETKFGLCSGSKSATAQAFR